MGLFGPMDDGVLARVRQARERFKRMYGSVKDDRATVYMTDMFVAVDAVFVDLLHDLEGSPTVRTLVLQELRTTIAYVGDAHDEIQEQGHDTIAALLSDVHERLGDACDRIEGVHDESPKKQPIRWAVWRRLDQTIGYLDEQGAMTTDHKAARLFEDQHEAIVAYMEHGGLRPDVFVKQIGMGIIEVHDEAEFRSREDTW